MLSDFPKRFQHRAHRDHRETHSTRRETLTPTTCHLKTSRHRANYALCAARTPLPSSTLCPTFSSGNFERFRARPSDQEIVIPEMRQPEHVTLHRALAVRDDHAKTAAHFLNDFGRLDSHRRVDCRHRIRRRTHREVREPKAVAASRVAAASSAALAIKFRGQAFFM